MTISMQRDSMRVRIYNKVLLMLVMMLCCVGSVKAQDDVEYRMEIGGGVNATAYQGDFSGSLTKGMQPGAAVVFRRILSPYMAVKIAGMYTHLKGSYDKAETVYPDMLENGYSFKNSMADLSVQYEYNFLPYGTGRDYRGAKRITPFVALGLGLTYAKCPDGTWDYSASTPHNLTKSVMACNMPLGLGVKYKVGDRTNIILDWQMHFSFSDHLDGVKDPYRIKSSGMFKNTDSYSTLSLSVTYCFSAKCSTCMKD